MLILTPCQGRSSSKMKYIFTENFSKTFSIPGHVQAILDEIFRDLLSPPTKVSEVVPHYNTQRTPCYIISECLLTVLAYVQKHQQTQCNPKYYDVTISWLCFHITEHLTTKVNLHFIYINMLLLFNRMQCASIRKIIPWSLCKKRSLFLVIIIRNT